MNKLTPKFQEPEHWNITESIMHLAILAKEERLMQQERNDPFLSLLFPEKPTPDSQWLESEEKRATARLAEGLEIFFKTLYYIDNPKATKEEAIAVAGGGGHKISAILKSLNQETQKELKASLPSYEVLCGCHKIGNTEGFLHHYRNPLTQTRYPMERPKPEEPHWGNPRGILLQLAEFIQDLYKRKKRN